MELGAFVVVPGGEDFKATREVPTNAFTALENSRPLYSSRMQIVGNDVLQFWMDRIRKLGVRSLWLTSGARNGTITRSELAKFAQQGVERLLVVKLNSYAEMDLEDLLRFHCESRNPVTEAHDARGQLGVCLLDQLAVRASGPQNGLSSASTDLSQLPYQFSGYAKRIAAARERQELVADALTGTCGMRPFGKQIGEQIWIGEDVNLASSARIIGPTYIGARTTIRAGATIGPYVSVERDCVVDCGTTVEQSTILPDTYLAPGLHVRDGVVDGQYLEHLGWAAVADLQPAGLGRRIPPRKSSGKAPSRTGKDPISAAGSVPAWRFGSSAVPSTAWLQVQL